MKKRQYRQGKQDSGPIFMPLRKRLLDIFGAVVLGLLLAPLICGLALLVWVFDGRPVFYISERMKTPTTSFRLVKFRTMRPDAADSGVSGAHKAGRITPMGRFLRRSRLDEVPQLWNILVGDMSFVGPRPPLRSIVEAFPEIYGPVLRMRPGLTGLATVVYHRHENRLLAGSQSAAETEAIYRRACVPRKARLDLIYQARWSVCFDIRLMFRTVFGAKRR